MQPCSRVRGIFVSSASALAVLAASVPAAAQVAEQYDSGIETIIVTAQRQAESLQDVPIAVSAFSGEAIERQQIENSSDLQLSLPNVSFSKTNFTSSSFTIRGVGDLCVGVTCDSATAIHVNDTPLLQTRLFETEFFDMERIEVLRGPQGTLFGRNATSGVVNLVTAKPDLSGFSAAGDAEYGNFNAYKLKGMVNVPLGDTLAVRVAGFYQKRDGYTTNLYDGSDHDDRDMYALRGSLRWEPTPSTTIDLMAYYFREDDKRSRIQKQMCARDDTGILGCRPDQLAFETVNGNATLSSLLSSNEFFALNNPALAPFGLGSIYAPNDVYAGVSNPASVRQVNTDYTPSYFSDEEQYQARITQDIGAVTLQVTGLYHKARVDSQLDYNLSVQNRAGFTPGLSALAAAAGGLFGPGLQAYLGPIAAALIPDGPGGVLCTSLSEPSGMGVYAGNALCATTPQDFDRSVQTSSDWSLEGILTSNFDGPLNFLVGGIYADLKLTENSYYVNAFGLDYASGVLGAASSSASGGTIPPSILATPYFRNNTDHFRLKSYGIFGEAYYEFSDRAKLTLGIRYNNDRKYVRARSPLLKFLAPIGLDDAFDSPYLAIADFDDNLPGNQLFQERRASFQEWTGRAVFDVKVTDDSLLYASYSRGYKSGGINPPLSPVFAVSDSFGPEFIDAFEVGSKNSFLDGSLQLNLTAFYYKYKGLQLSRIVSRTSVNDNVDADIYGIEADAIVSPGRGLLVNLGFSYLHTKVASDKFLADPRDPSGGRSYAVILKDLAGGANCALVPTAAGVPRGDAVVDGFNAEIGLAPTVPVPGTNTTGAFSLCAELGAFVAGSSLPYEVLGTGVPVNIRGNKLPQAPNYKFSTGVQYTADFQNGMSLVPRADLTYTGESYGTIFNGQVNKIPGYVQVNAQLQLNGPDERWYVRGFVQNLFDNNAMTGLYVSDQSTGLFTNIFTLEPRRYGIGAGVRF